MGALGRVAVNSPGAYVYILHGEDAFSRDEALHSLKERMRAQPAGEHNLTELRDADATVARLQLAADALPFLADRRIVVVHGLLTRLQGKGDASGRKARQGGRRVARAGAAAAHGSSRLESQRDDAATDEYPRLLEYLGGVPPTTSVVFVEPGTVEAGPLVAAIPPGRAFVRVFPGVRFEDLPGWIRRRARMVGVDLDESAVRELAQLGGGDLRRLDGELRKLAAFADGQTATRADVHALVVGHDVSVWALLDALVERRVGRALVALRQLYAQGEAPEAILGRDVAPLYRRLLAAREVARLGRAARAAFDAGSLGLNPHTLPRLVDQATWFDSDELERALELLLDLDRRIKTGDTDPEAALEVAIVRLCGRLSATAAA